MNNITITLVDKIGVSYGGIAFMLSLGVEDVYYDAMYWVNGSKAVFTTSTEGEEALGFNSLKTGPKEDSYNALLAKIEELYPMAELIKEIKTEEGNDN
jgi:hypothetical protein